VVLVFFYVVGETPSPSFFGITQASFFLSSSHLVALLHTLSLVRADLFFVISGPGGTEDFPPPSLLFFVIKTYAGTMFPLFPPKTFFSCAAGFFSMRGHPFSRKIEAAPPPLASVRRESTQTTDEPSPPRCVRICARTRFPPSSLFPPKVHSFSFPKSPKKTSPGGGRAMLESQNREHPFPLFASPPPRTGGMFSSSLAISPCYFFPYRVIFPCRKHM